MRYLKIANLSKIGHFTPVERCPIAPPRVHKIEKRLGLKTVAQLVADYQAGLTTRELMDKYTLGKGTVLRLLRDHGVEVRNQSLTGEQAGEAITLYLEGWSLARIGARFDRQHTVIRDILVRAGIPRRDSHGRERS